MTSVAITQARAGLSSLIDRAIAGEEICITRHGKPVALLTPIPQPRKPIDIAALRAVSDGMPFQEQSAGEFIRWMRDTDRY